MSDMIKILFYSRKSRVNSDGRVPINMRITLNGQRFEVATSRYVLPNEWSDEAMTTTRKSRDSKEIDEFLQTLRAKALSIQKKLLMVDKKLTIEEFSNQWHGRKEKPKMLLEIFRQHNEQVKALIGTQYSHATWKRYNTSHDHTLHFLQQKYGVSDISVDKIKYEFITDYEFWLKSIRKCNHNSTIKYLTNFKKIVHICLNNGWIDKNPFVGFKMANKEVERPFLTEEELQTIASKEFLMPRIDQVRDLFLFCCYTGLAYVDICKLKRSEIANGVDGEKWIFTNRQKTESASRIPLLPPALKIIDKYKDHPECKIKDCLFPVPSNQKMNLYLKEIADACGISKNFTTVLTPYKLDRIVVLVVQ